MNIIVVLMGCALWCLAILFFSHDHYCGFKWKDVDHAPHILSFLYGLVFILIGLLV